MRGSGQSPQAGSLEGTRPQTAPVRDASSTCFTAFSPIDHRLLYRFRICAACQRPLDHETSAGIARGRLCGLGNWLIAKVGMSRLDSAGDAIDLAAATVRALGDFE